jgi:DNA-binding NtrC family response regulator
VLITGESGVGKELIAEAIRDMSPRCSGPFVTINIAAVPETLVESELFGHVKGAFTGASTERSGRFEAADGGTLFIDEVGELALPLQAKLLRVLENQKISPVGGNEDRQTDVRLVAATSRELEQMVWRGEFREELYYRLNVVNIRVPPLRERRGDILLLVRHFVEAICTEYAREQPDIDPRLLRFLEQHDWPGNVRQLRNCVESMVVLSQSNTLTLEDLPCTAMRMVKANGNPPTLPQSKTLAELERIAVIQRLDQCHGNRTRAARSLGVSLRTLQRKLRKWGVRGYSQNGRDEGVICG